MHYTQAIDSSKVVYDVRFVHYTQSSRCTTMKDSSVSYAAAIVSHAASSSERKRKSSSEDGGI